MTSTDNTSKDFEQFKAILKDICDVAEVINLERNGRPDCKNCALLETIRETLL
jgi:radical SAM superfamily enzyme